MKSLDEKIAEWVVVKTQLQEYKDLELELRNDIVANAFDTSKHCGTETLELGNDYQLKACKKLTYSLDKKKLPEVLEKLPYDVARRIVKFTPSLSVTEYNKNLRDEERALIDTVLTIKPATPTLTFVEPKK